VTITRAYSLCTTYHPLCMCVFTGYQ